MRKFSGWLTWRGAFLLAAPLILTLPRFSFAQSAACMADTLSRAELASEMRSVVDSQTPFDLLATTNWMRFQSALFLRLVRRASELNPTGGVVSIPAKDLFWEFVPLAGLSIDEAERAPPFLLWALHLDQETRLEYRPDSVVLRVKKGLEPVLAANVVFTWPDREGGQDKYSFIDTLSVPKLKVTNRQKVTIRLLDFGDMVVYDKIRGTSGRPLSGVLGALFKVIGEGDVKYSRAGMAEDGVQVLRAQAKKLFTKTATVTIFPDGVAEKDVPEDRPDLAAIAARLKEDLELEYYPYRCW